jgi:hypothetical protein
MSLRPHRRLPIPRGTDAARPARGNLRQKPFVQRYPYVQAHRAATRRPGLSHYVHG